MFGPHALEEMEWRGITERDVRAALERPGRAEVVRPGRVVVTTLQTNDANGRQYVLRVFVDVDRKPPVVVTAYRSSKLRKYWSNT